MLLMTGQRQRKRACLAAFAHGLIVWRGVNNPQ
jgi:hypothetical protein